MIEELALISSFLAAPVLAGALKDMSISGPVRTLVKILAPATGMFPLCYLFYTVLEQAGVQVSFDGSHPSGGSVAVIVFAAASYFASMKLVDFGERIGDQEHTGVGNDTKRATETMLEAIAPKMQQHISSVERAIGQALDERAGSYLSKIERLTDNLVGGFATLEEMFRKGSSSVDALQSLVEKNQKLHASQEQAFKEMGGYLAANKMLFDSLDEKYAILDARIEALGGREKQDESSEYESLTETKLTSQDGSANRNIGIEAQHEMARYLSDLGFEIKEGRAAGEADYIIRKDGKVIAIGSNKAFMLYDEPKRMQRRISTKDVEPELVLARNLGVPMVVLVTNRRNNRRWAQLVKKEELAEWSGVSTPVMLAKDDDESGRILQEEFSSALASFGAVV